MLSILPILFDFKVNFNPNHSRIPIKEGDQGSLKEVKLIEFIAKVYLE